MASEVNTTPKYLFKSMVESMRSGYPQMHIHFYISIKAVAAVKAHCSPDIIHILLSEGQIMWYIFS